MPANKYGYALVLNELLLVSSRVCPGKFRTARAPRKWCSRIKSGKNYRIYLRERQCVYYIVRAKIHISIRKLCPYKHTHIHDSVRNGNGRDWMQYQLVNKHQERNKREHTHTQTVVRTDSNKKASTQIKSGKELKQSERWQRHSVYANFHHRLLQMCL